MPAPSRYPEELRDRAVRLVFDMRAETGQRKGPIKKVANQLGINPETLRNWVRRAEVDRRERPGTTFEDGDRIKQLEREVRDIGAIPSVGSIGDPSTTPSPNPPSVSTRPN